MCCCLLVIVINWTGVNLNDVVMYTFFLSCKVGMKRSVCKFRCYAVCVCMCMCVCVRVCVRRPIFVLVRARFCWIVIVQFVCVRRICLVRSRILRCISSNNNVSDQ